MGLVELLLVLSLVLITVLVTISARTGGIRLGVMFWIGVAVFVIFVVSRLTGDFSLGEETLGCRSFDKVHIRQK